MARHHPEGRAPDRHAPAQAPAPEAEASVRDSSERISKPSVDGPPTGELTATEPLALGGPPLDSAAERERWLAARAAEILYDQSAVAYLASAVAVAITAGLLQPVVRGSVLWSWTAVILVTFLLRYLMVRRFQARDPTRSDPHEWLQRHVVGVTVTGLLWGSAGWLLFVDGSLLHQAFLIALLCGVAMASIALLPMLRGGFAVFGPLVLMPLALRLLLVGETLQQALSVLLVILLIILGVSASSLQRQARTSLELRYENRNLVRRLRRTNRGLRVEMKKRNAAHRELQRREAVLDAVAFAAARLLVGEGWEDDIDEILARLGRAAGASRTYVFQFLEDDGRLVARRLHQWRDESVTPPSDSPEVVDLDLEALGLLSWAERLSAGEGVAGLAESFTDGERELLARRGIRSIALVPIPVGNDLWGLLGFDDRRFDHEWSHAEVEALQTAADALAAAIRNERAEEGRQDSERRFRLLAEHTRDLVCLHAPDARYIYVSPSCKEILGYLPEELEGEDHYRLVAPEDRDRVRRDSHKRVLAGLRSHVIAYRFQRASGEYVWLETVTEPVLGPGGEVVQLVTSSRDITERKRAEEQLFYEKELAQVTLQSIGEGVITTDAAGLIDYINPVAEKLTGWELADGAGRPLDEVFHLVDEEDHRPVEGLVGSVLRGSERVVLPEHSVLVGPGGREFAIEATAAPIRDRSGRTLGTVFVFRDVTKTRELAQQLSYQASHDPLTGLINRRELEARLAASLERADSEKRDVLCYLDLDQFKVVNDTCGHIAGDEFLRRLGSYLRSRVRRSDSLARLGGDEFGILLQACPLDRAVEVAREAGRGIRNFRFEWQERVFAVGASIGVVDITSEFDSVGDVLRAADAACYAAKDRGRNRVQVYQQDDRELTRRHGEVQWLPRLHDALANDSFELWAQPILGPAVEARATAQQPRRMEILVSLREPGGERISPGSFIPVAERYNLMPAIDRWVIDHAFSSLAGRWWTGSEDGGEDELCFINLSGTSVTDETFQAFVEDRLAHYGVPACGVCFEITETAAIANLTEATRFMSRLKELGVRFALDDFGSGLSSFAHLRALPVDFLKIDGAFVRDIESDSVDYAMVESINRIGHLLGLETIAEYVESEGILERVQALSVDLVQGFAIGRPRPLDEILGGRDGRVGGASSEPFGTSAKSSSAAAGD